MLKTLRPKKLTDRQRERVRQGKPIPPGIYVVDDTALSAAPVRCR